MKTIVIKIIGAVLLLALLGFGVYYFLTQASLKTVLKDNVQQETQSKIEYKIDGNTISLLIDDKSVQTISLSSDALDFLATAPKAEKFITNLDVNFDGQNDVGIFVSTGYGGVNNYYDFYLYNPKIQRFEKNEQLTQISNPSVDFIAGMNNVVISTFRSGPMWYSDLYFHTKSNIDDTDIYNKEPAKEPNPDMSFQYYRYQPTRIIPEMPFKNIFLSILNDTTVDTSIVSNRSGWEVYVIEKENNKAEGRKDSPVYLEDVLSLFITKISDWNSRLEDERKDIKSFGRGSVELKQQIFNGVTWNYYDFVDGYDGGYLRTYFIEKDGYVISFAVSDEVISANQDISKIEKIQFLNKLSF